MFCVLILYISGGTYSLTSTPNDRFYLLSSFLCTLHHNYSHNFIYNLKTKEYIPLNYGFPSVGGFFVNEYKVVNKKQTPVVEVPYLNDDDDNVQLI